MHRRGRRRAGKRAVEARVATITQGAELVLAHAAGERQRARRARSHHAHGAVEGFSVRAHARGSGGAAGQTCSPCNTLRGTDMGSHALPYKNASFCIPRASTTPTRYDIAPRPRRRDALGAAAMVLLAASGREKIYRTAWHAAQYRAASSPSDKKRQTLRRPDTKGDYLSLGIGSTHYKG